MISRRSTLRIYPISTFTDTFLRAHLRAILHRVQSEIDLGYRPFIMNCAMERVSASMIHLMSPDTVAVVAIGEISNANAASVIGMDGCS